MTQEKLAAPADQPAADRAATWTRRHLLDVDDFTAVELDTVMDTTDAMKEVMGREVPRVPALRGKTIVTLFYEASTRTRASFELAGKALGADVINISAGGSSIEKGESLIDTVRTLLAVGADLLVMRHGASGAPYLVARHLKAAVVNAGDGWHAHPTQALLDVYTIRTHLGDVRGRRIVIVGDVAHSRVARSNIWALSTMGAEIVVCAPPTLLPAGLRSSTVARRPSRDGDAIETLAMPPIHIETNLDTALEDADVVMTLRLQKERMHAGLLPSLREYANLYQLNEERISHARTGALVMHPGPMNEGIEISPSLASSLQSVIEEQVTNGVAVRMAILYLLARGGR